MTNRFYVYAYLDPRKPGRFRYGRYTFNHEPFYVGKGRDWRLREHLWEAYAKKDENSHKCNIIRKIKRELKKDPIIIKIKEKLIDSQAKKLEQRLIKIIGRLDLKTGSLTNKTDGGDGSEGYKQTSKAIMKIAMASLGRKHSDDFKRRLSNRMRGKNNPFFGKKHTKEARKKNSESHIGIGVGKDNSNYGNRWTEAQRKKQSERQIGKHTQTARYKRELSERMRGRRNPSKKLSVRLKISAALLGVPKPESMCGENNPAKRPEVRLKISKTKLRQNKKY